MSDDREGGGFKVTDRRRFAGDAPPSDDDASAGDAERAAGSPSGAPSRGDVSGVTFASVVIGLSTQALVHLGEITEQSGAAPARDLDAAQQLIDILAVLQAKTTGNLDAEEAGLLEAVLYDLRIRYVAIAKHPGPDPGKETA